MSPRHPSMHLVRALAAPRLAAGVLVSLALLSAACTSDPTSRITSPMSMSASASASSSYAVLAGTAVTCTDSHVVGDVGAGSVITQTNCTIDGVAQTGGVATQAYLAFRSAYAALAQTPCDQVLTTLDGQTLSPGVYCFDAAATSTGGVLTLSGPANGTWLFKIGTLGTGALTGTNFTMVMADGSPVPCNDVTWWVAQAVTLTDSRFVGTIYAGSDITITRGTFNGNAYAGGAGLVSVPSAVTLTGTTLIGCPGSTIGGGNRGKCNQGVGNGPEGCDPGDSNHHNGTNDESGGTPGSPGRKPTRT